MDKVMRLYCQKHTHKYYDTYTLKNDDISNVVIEGFKPLVDEV